MLTELSARARTAPPAAAVVAAACALVLLIAGCGSEPAGEAQEPLASGTYTGAVPEFDGPYADMFEENYVSAPSDFVRQVLEDGSITDAEYAEMAQGFADCLAGEGIEFGGFRADGGYETSLAPNGADTHAKIAACSKTVGEDLIGSLYTFIKTNPNNQDYEEIVPECLVDAGVVPAGYGPEEYAADSQGRFADPESLDPALHETLLACLSDPLGLLGE